MSEQEAPEIPAGFPESRLLVFWCETPLHPGIGMVMKGGVDLPIQREKLTGFPMMQASGIKGALRKAAKLSLSNNEIDALFGPEPERLRGSERAGSMLLTDAHILLFPVSSVKGMMCWATSPMILARFRQALRYIGKDLSIPQEIEDGKIIVRNNSYLKIKVKNKDKVILMDELELEVDLERSQEAEIISEWIKNNVIPDDPSYTYIKHVLPFRFAIVNDEVFKRITERGTEVITRVRLTDAKVVAEGGLWSEEHVPAFTVFYCSVFMPSKFRGEDIGKEPKEVFDELIRTTKRIVLGGHETVGKGVVRIVSVFTQK